MSRDRFITFDGNRPNPTDVTLWVKEYLGDMATMCHLSSGHSRLVVDLAGRVTRHGEETPRWIEVVFTEQIDVLTRDMDGPTNDIADGIARMIARRSLATLHWSDFPAPRRPEEDKNHYVLRFQSSPAMEEALMEVQGFCLKRQVEHCAVHDEMPVGVAHGVINRILINLLQ